ncbi:hypothetical protein VQL36_03160 [Chengkuizengella sp. SCS-71B]|uniref:hypothetical protein n=1 Tax=Chengkuizengella sp. SCS-71B TaxID=3115290 RepID=UPI0032C22A74
MADGLIRKRRKITIVKESIAQLLVYFLFGMIIGIIFLVIKPPLDVWNASIFVILVGLASSLFAFYQVILVLARNLLNRKKD